MDSQQAPSPELITAVGTALAELPVDWRPVLRGYTQAEHWIVTLKSGRTAFVKAATDERTSQWLQSEWLIYQEVQANFIPQALAFAVQDGFPFLILEDLSKAIWPPPWNIDRIDQVQAGLSALHKTTPPRHLPTLEEARAKWSGWAEVTAEPSAFLELGVCSETWFNKHSRTLAWAEEHAPLQGNDLVHSDIRSDNLCLTSKGAVFIDWNYACRGNGTIDVVNWLPTLHLEGGPAPWDITLNHPELISLMAGYYAFYASQPPLRPGVRIHRELQKATLQVTLAWACHALNLPLPAELVRS